MTDVTHKCSPMMFSMKQMDEDGTFAGYASVFNTIDSQADMILSGAFSETLKDREGDIKLLWQHHLDEPIGIFNSIKEDEHGLFVEGKLLLDVVRASEAHTLIKQGGIRGLSIGYTVKEASLDESRNIRLIHSVDLWEVSVVTFPANEEAEILYVKDYLPATVREFERFLRQSGFSRNKSKEIAASGFKYGGHNPLLGSVERAIEVLSS